jgi:hypothetical protein
MVAEVYEKMQNGNLYVDVAITDISIYRIAYVVFLVGGADSNAAETAWH